MQMLVEYEHICHVSSDGQFDNWLDLVVWKCLESWEMPNRWMTMSLQKRYAYHFLKVDIPNPMVMVCNGTLLHGVAVCSGNSNWNCISIC